MKSKTTEKFRKAYRGLPAEIQQQARDAYRLWKRDPSHPSLHFKKVHDTKPILNMTGCFRSFEQSYELL